MAWQEMDSAPQDGSRVLVCNEYGVPIFVAWNNGWRCQKDLPAWEPSYWFPLDKAPNAVI